MPKFFVQLLHKQKDNILKKWKTFTLPECFKVFVPCFTFKLYCIQGF